MQEELFLGEFQIMKTKRRRPPCRAVDATAPPSRAPPVAARAMRRWSPAPRRCRHADSGCRLRPQASRRPSRRTSRRWSTSQSLRSSNPFSTPPFLFALQRQRTSMQGRFQVPAPGLHQPALQRAAAWWSQDRCPFQVDQITDQLIQIGSCEHFNEASPFLRLGLFSPTPRSPPRPPPPRADLRQSALPDVRAARKLDGLRLDPRVPRRLRVDP